MSRAETVRRAARALLVVVLLVACVSIGTPVVLRALVDRHLYTSAVDVPTADVAIVLGASVVRGKPSPVLAERANAAIELYQSGKAYVILVTGDSMDRTHDEVSPVRAYLEAAGIPSRAIAVDRAGVDTYSSMFRAREVFCVPRAVIVTQDFHLPRAVFIARAVGIDASGFVAPGTERSPYEYLREIPASVKAVWDVFSGRIPEGTQAELSFMDDCTSKW
ncbi:hypothetical protein FJY94_00495 [Candidatus Kaiserbacteria bacterium]|nr:hypothetical protein [Candidatus Kaiserbacteria bacterium]